MAQAQAEAVTGENLSAVEIANSIAARREKEAEAQRIGTAAEKVAAARALEESYKSEEAAERQRAKREEAAQVASIVVQAEIERRKIEVLAEAEKNRIRLQAEAEKTRVELQAEAEKRRIELIAAADAEKIRILKEGEAAGLKAIMEAQAQGTLAQLEARARGFQAIVHASGGAEKAAQLMITEQLPALVAEQVKAISGVKIDKVTVWDSGRAGEDGKTRTADFLSGLVGSVPPLHDIAKNVGVELPSYLGKPAVETAPTISEEESPTL
ncbi:MAG: hypothetical protein LDL31_06620 [Prosthecobacter sp.]|nr:hypothetical protein [Prosthecobacter sp.]